MNKEKFVMKIDEETRQHVIKSLRDCGVEDPYDSLIDEAIYRASQSSASGQDNWERTMDRAVEDVLSDVPANMWSRK
jgi:hypothetical protein